MDEEYTRIYFEESLGRHADEVLETLFSQVHFNRINGQDAEIGLLLDQYANVMFGAGAIPLGDSLTNVDRAKRWAGQFGVVQRWEASDDELADDTESVERGARYVAQVGDSQRVCMAHPSTAIVLAGIQHLREISVAVLNRSAGEKMN